MRIVHIAPNAPYNDNWGYQDNLLPRYQKKLGHHVTMITTNTMHKDGKIVETDCGDYVLDDGVRVIRLKREQYFHRVITNLRAYMKVYDLLRDIQPDFIFFHGLISTTIFDAIRYKKKDNPNCVIVQDNHLDYNIGRNANGFRAKIIRAYYRKINAKSIKYVHQVYGVTPWRKKYAKDYFRIPEDKISLLIMGADDDVMNLDNRDAIREKIREKHGILDNDFLVVTGGKIDNKKKVIILMKAVKDLKNTKLIVFGSVSPEIKNTFKESLNNNVIFVGWITAEEVYRYFFAADLVLFPGQHSVLWEQACAAKVPCVFEYWDGMEHVNNGGNADFLKLVTKDNIVEKLSELRFTDKYFYMKKIAESEKTDIFLYSNIARKSLEYAPKY